MSKHAPDERAHARARIELLVLPALRPSEELKLALAYLDAETTAGDDGARKLTSLGAYAQALLAANEFMYVD